MCLCDVDYIGYTTRHLHQRIMENLSSNIGKDLKIAHGFRDIPNVSGNFTILNNAFRYVGLPHLWDTAHPSKTAKFKHAIWLWLFVPKFWFDSTPCEHCLLLYFLAFYFVYHYYFLCYTSLTVLSWEINIIRTLNLFYFDNDISDIETSVFSVVFFSEIYLPLFKESLLPRAPDQIVSIRVSAVGAVTMVDAVTQVDKTFSSKEIQVDMDPEPDKDLYGNWKRICKEHSYFLN